MVNKKYKVCLLACTVFLLSFAIYIQMSSASIDQDPNGSQEADSFQAIGSVSMLSITDITDAETALRHGIYGYIEISAAPGTPSLVGVTQDSATTDVTILLSFVSHAPDTKNEAKVSVDLNSPNGLTIEQYTEDGVIKLNDIISYNVTGTITIRAGETVPICVTIQNLPLKGESIPLEGVGIMSDFDVAIIHNIGVRLYG